MTKRFDRVSWEDVINEAKAVADWLVMRERIAAFDAHTRGGPRVAMPSAAEAMDALRLAGIAGHDVDLEMTWMRSIIPRREPDRRPRLFPVRGDYGREALP